MFIPEKDSADLDDAQLPQLSNSITTTTDLTNLTSTTSQHQQLNSSSSDHQSDQTSRLGDELELSATYILEHQPKALVSRSSSLSFQNHPQQPDIQMLQTIQPLQPLIEHRPSIDTIDSYVESKFIDSKFMEQPNFMDSSFVESKLLDNNTSALLSSFPFNSSRLPNSASFNAQHPYFEQFNQFEPIGLLDHQNVNTANQARCGPTVVLITHDDQSMFTNYTDHPANFSNTNSISYQQDGYHHSNLINSEHLINSSNQLPHPDHIHHSNC